MRATFASTLLDLARNDERIVLLTADLGFMVLEEFAREMPGRFLNVGVAEQNMIGVATGLAESGFLPFVYSIAPFAVLRPFEFIRNGPVAHDLPVRIVGVGGGFEYGHNGLSHYGIEDIAVMRSQPSMRVIVPADAQQAANALRETCTLDGPIYYRLGKDDRPRLPGLDGRFRLGACQTIRPGRDVLVVATGAISLNALAATEQLRQAGIDAGFMLVDQFNCVPLTDLETALATVPLVVTAEAHVVNGGLGSLVSEVIAENQIGCRVVRCGIRTPIDGITGGEIFMNRRHRLMPEQIAESAVRGLEVVRGAM